MKKSLAHLPEYKREELKLIVKIIRQQFPSSHMIILFGSYARGEWKEILKELENLRLYGAVHQNNAVFIVVDGLLNYSYGYMLTPLAPELIHTGPLFNFQVLENIENTGIYFYLSN